MCAVPAEAQDPRYEKEVAAYEARDRVTPPPAGQILFVGSSTIVDWDSARFFPDLRILNRGLWGSALHDTSRSTGNWS
jgi:hypothetical protein